MKFRFLIEERYQQVVEVEAETLEAATEDIETMLDSGDVDLSTTGDRVSQDYREL